MANDVAELDGLWSVLTSLRCRPVSAEMREDGRFAVYLNGPFGATEGVGACPMDALFDAAFAMIALADRVERQLAEQGQVS